YGFARGRCYDGYGQLELLIPSSKVSQLSGGRIASATFTARQKRQATRVATQSLKVRSLAPVHTPGNCAPTGLKPRAMHFFCTLAASRCSSRLMRPLTSFCGGPRQVLLRSASFMMIVKLSFLHLRKAFQRAEYSLPAR